MASLIASLMASPMTALLSLLVLGECVASLMTPLTTSPSNTRAWASPRRAGRRGGQQRGGELVADTRPYNPTAHSAADSSEAGATPRVGRADFDAALTKVSPSVSVKDQRKPA